MTEITYGRTPLGQLVYDLGFTKLDERYLARKHRRPVAEIRRLRRLVRMGLAAGRKQERKRRKARR